MKQAPPFALALVTGATSGIGLRLSELLAEKGISLLLHGRDRSRLEAVAANLSGKVAVSIIVADLSTADGQQQISSAIQKHVPDLLINNAGFGLYGLALTHTTAEQLKMLAVDGEAVVRFSMECARALQAKGKGGVVMNISSVAAYPVSPRLALYSASKALVNQFSESFDAEVSPCGIRILVACPGAVATNFRTRAGGFPSSKWDPLAMSVDFAAQEIWKQIIQRKKFHIFNWIYRVIAFFVRYFLPKALVAKIFNRVILHIQTSP